MLTAYTEKEAPTTLTLVRKKYTPARPEAEPGTADRVLEFDEVQTFVSDLQQARHFYHDILGLPLRSESNEYLVFDLSGVDFTILPGAASELRQKPYGSERATVICLKTPNIEAVYSKLAARGVEFVSTIQKVPSGKFVPFEDPDGNLLELIQTSA